MRIERLTLLNFKNITSAELNFTEQITALVGDNGAGKSNIIDAVHYLSMAKSMVVMTDSQSVCHGTDFFMVDGELCSDEQRHLTVSCSFSKQRGHGKKLKLNGKEYDKLSDHIGLVPVVVVAPQDSILITDAAEERRRWLNSAISQIDSGYLAALIRYNAILLQRNRALKSHCDDSMLEIYDQQLIPQAEIINARRREFVAQIEPLVERYYATLSGDREEVSIAYRSALNETPFAELLSATRQKDIVNEHTTSGVHRDDLVFTIGGYPLRKYGSQGQQKSFLIALKLAQYEVVASARSEKPLLLLDDLFDKLDSSRVSQLISLVAGEGFGQIFITDCSCERLEPILRQASQSYSIYNVNAGEVEALNR